MNSDKIGTHVIKDDQFVNEGIIDFDFIQLEKQAGYVGFIFRYKDDKDFYIIDFLKNNARLR